MVGDDSVTLWLDGVKAGDDLAIRKLWDRYFQRLIRVAARRLPAHARRDIDEEDVALSAFHNFCDDASRGKYPQLTGRDDLWRLLVVITGRKVVGLIRHRGRRKRGGGMVVGESALREGPGPSGEGLARCLGREPSPELAAELADDHQRLLDALGSDTLRTVALMRLDGHTTGEISRSLEISPRSVERKLRLIRKIWEGIALGEP
jgi:DNA-directed RNA polymerase specialized sigma24 family protein